MLLLVFVSCAADLADLHATAAVSNFEFIALAPNERRALEIDLPDVLQAGDTEREFDLSEFAYPDGLNLYVGRGLDRLITDPSLSVDGVLPCRVREIWHATAGEVVITSERPISESSGGSLVLTEIGVSVSGVVLQNIDGEDSMEVDAERWFVAHSESDDSWEAYVSVSDASPCYYPD